MFLPSFLLLMLIRYDDDIGAYNRYPENFTRISIIQYPKYKIGFDEKIGKINVLSQRDEFGLEVLNQEDLERMRFGDNTYKKEETINMNSMIKDFELGSDAHSSNYTLLSKFNS